MIETIDTGACTARVDAVAGAGVVVRRNVEDVSLPGLPVEMPDGLIGYGSGSLVGDSWNAMVRRIYADGWEFLDDEDGGTLPLAYSPKEGTAFALWPKALDVKQMSEDHFMAVFAEWEAHVLELLERFGGRWVLYEG